MKQSLDIKPIIASLTRFFARFHSIVFFLVISITLIGCIVIILSIINLSSSTDASTDTQIDQTFDEQTINRLKQLQDTDEDSRLELPNGRVNPFSE